MKKSTMLERFLKGKRLYDKFILNYSMAGDGLGRKDMDIEEYFREYGKSRDGINYAFIWDASPEGMYYWSKWNTKWITHYEKNNT